MLMLLLSVIFISVIIFVWIGGMIASYQEAKVEIKKIKDKNKEKTEYQEYIASLSEKELKKHNEMLKSKERILSVGEYEVGKDIEEGTYNIISLSGIGNIEIGYDKVNGTFPPFRKKNVKVAKGQKVKISGKLTVKFEAVR